MQLIWIIPEACVHSSLLSLFSVRIGDQSIVGVVDICGHVMLGGQHLENNHKCPVPGGLFLQHVATWKSWKRYVSKACLRGDVVMVEQLLFFGISPEICCNWLAIHRPYIQLRTPASVALLFDCSSFFGMFRLVPCLLGVGKVYAADDFRAEKEWLDGNSATFVLPLCLAGFKCRTKLPYAKNTYVCHRLPCADIDSLKASKNSYSYSGPGWKFGRTSLWCTWRYWVMPMLLNCIQSHSVNCFGSSWF